MTDSQLKLLKFLCTAPESGNPQLGRILHSEPGLEGLSPEISSKGFYTCPEIIEALSLEDEEFVEAYRVLWLRRFVETERVLFSSTFPTADDPDLVDFRVDLPIRASEKGRVWLESNSSESGQATLGVSLLEAAQVFENDAEEKTSRRRDKWRDQTSVTRPPSIGKHQNHRQQDIYEPAAIVAFVKKVEGYIPSDESLYLKRLISISKPPRTD